MYSCQAGDVFLAPVFQDGSAVPERREVVVISPKYLNQRRGVANVVPLTIRNDGEIATRNRNLQLTNIPLEKEYYWAGPGKRVWADCEDMQLVDLTQFEPVVMAHDKERRRNSVATPVLSREDLRRVRLGAIHVIDVPKDMLRKSVLTRFRDYLKQFSSPTADRKRSKKSRKKKR